jgi:hypothetical protein
MIQRYIPATLELIQHELAAGCQVRLHVTTGSMRPLIRPGDWIQLSATPPEHLGCGEIITLRRGDILITHRLLHHDFQWWYAMGDSAAWPDPRVPAEAVLGRVVAIERGSQVVNLLRPRWWAINRLLGWVRWHTVGSGRHGEHAPVHSLLATQRARLARVGFAKLVAIAWWFTSPGRMR